MASLNILLFTALLALLFVTCHGFRLQNDLENEFEGNSKEFEDSQKAIPVRPGKRESSVYRMLNDPQYHAIPVRPGKRGAEANDASPQWPDVYSPFRPGRK